MHIEFSPLKTSCCKEFQELLDIYHDAFPPEERQPDKVLRKNIDTGFSHAFIGTEARKVVFFLHAYDVPQTPLVFLDYAATRSEYRGKQVTRRFFEQAFSWFGHDRILFGQQEDPEYGENRDAKRKRIAYFRGMGFRYLRDTPFILPDHAGGNNITPMVLCVMTPNPVSTLPGKMLAEAVRFIFLQVYRSNEEDALLHKNLDLIPAKITVS